MSGFRSRGVGIFLTCICLSFASLLLSRAEDLDSDILSRCQELGIMPSARLGTLLVEFAATETGRRTLKKACSRWTLQDISELESKIEWGDVSRTDSVLVRHFDPKTQSETRERQIRVFLKKGEENLETLMDLAHELTHALSEPGWDPYDPFFMATQYIRAVIEGVGGEADALENECSLVLEIQDQFLKSKKSDLENHVNRCQQYIVRGVWSREKVVKDFYKVGTWRPELDQSLGVRVHDLPFLSSEAAVLFSSTGQAPYPNALLREFEGLSRSACENSKRRLDFLASSQKDVVTKNEMAKNESLNQFLKKRCQHGSTSQFR